jgi:hypothetical protein
MIRFAYTLCAALFLLGCISLIPVLSQDKKGEEKPADMNAEWEKLNAPGPMQKWLAEEVGDWNVEGKMWMGPDAVPFKATSKITMFADRYLHEEFKGDDKMPMVGFGMFGYDNSNKEFQGLWTDNMTTSMHVLSGQLDEKTGKLTMSGSWTEKGMNNMKSAMRIVSTRKSKDEAVVEVYGSMGDQPETKMVELTYTRKK